MTTSENKEAPELTDTEVDVVDAPTYTPNLKRKQEYLEDPDKHDESLQTIVVDDIDATNIDMNVKLRSGITLNECFARSALWWDHIGRDLMRKLKEKNRAANGDAVIGSNIIEAKKYSQMNNRERLRIAKTWYDNIFLAAERGQIQATIDAVNKGSVH